MPKTASSNSSRQSAKPPLSLPKGGGAIKGLNEKFSIDAFTGSGTSSVSIFEAPERLSSLGGVSATYNSSTGNGLLGIGWSIDQPSIKRRTDKGVPRYEDNNLADDIFCLLYTSPSPRD